MKKEKSIYTKWLIMAYELENNQFLEAVKKGFLMVVPVLFIGAVALVIKSFPVEGFQTFLVGWLGGSILHFLDGIYKATYGMLSVYLTISISMSLSRKIFKGKRYTQGLTVVLSVICLAEALGIANENFSYTEFGNTGVFMAIVVSLLIPYLFEKIQKLFFKEEMRDFMISDEMDAKLFRGGVFPFICCLVLFFVLNTLVHQICGYDNLNELFAAFFGYAFKSVGSNLFSGLLFLFVSGILWFLGIHGGNALELVSQNIFVPTNTNPNVIMSKTFLDVFGLMGGCGATVCMIIAILLFSRKKKHRNLARLALPTVFFNVNEIMVFGFPIMFNPIMLIPFVLTPMVSVTIAYAAAYFGIMPVPTAMVEWTTPVLLSGYAVTGSVAGLLVQLTGIICGVCIYTPFLRLLEQVEQERDDFLIEELEHIFLEKQEEGIPLLFSKLHHGMMSMSVALAETLKQDIIKHRVKICYQPQIDRDGGMFGVEALLRWDYYGRNILPPLVSALAGENQMAGELSMEILRRSISDMKPQISKNPNFKLSVNQAAELINERKYVEEFLRIAQDADVCSHLCIEITEETNMDNLQHITENIRYLKGFGIRFAMDDFSMGHTSVKYLKENLFDYVKLDGGMIRELMRNKRSVEIVSSIIRLGEKLQFQVIAEYVDDEKKADILRRLGCDYFQGYLYSPAISADQLDHFFDKNKCS